MSGHSKWSTIKRQKGAADIKRGQAFTKVSNAISIAVKQSGGNTDPESNFKLRIAVDKARAANMPKENIERAIKRALGADAGESLQEALYEGFAPGGAAILVEAVTDNKQRTVAEVKNVLEKNGGTMGSSGSVSYLFERVGQIFVKNPGKTEDELLEAGIEISSQDFQVVDDSVVFYTSPTDLIASKKKLEELGFLVTSSELVYKPITVIEVSEEILEKIGQVIEKVEELSDVQSVYTNV